MINNTLKDHKVFSIKVGFGEEELMIRKENKLAKKVIVKPVESITEKSPQNDVLK